MASPLEKIYFVHEGKAAYPEISAYRDFFAERFASEEARFENLAAKPDLERSICWHMMGFYPKRPPAGRVIHDYRSLSVGKLRRLKDRIKNRFNCRPDIRIFQNGGMRDIMGFSGDVPAVLLGMGVPSFAPGFRPAVLPEAEYDFAYIGAMSAERRTSLMIDSFLRRYGGTKSFLLLGAPDPELTRRYGAHPNVVFAGRMSQEDVFRRLVRTRCAVNYFPVHYPHALQTPTKLLEYAALGLRIIANEQPQSRKAAETYGIKCLWGGAQDLFGQAPDKLDWDDNHNLDPSPMLWPAIIGQSGVAGLIAALEEGTP
ncbi:MAG: glycosyltransferase family 1 protein [Alphaproteobacteria bacterium]|nr:glycosyltransferase family 1 protein [Alphaproteobacteria bacterium]